MQRLRATLIASSEKLREEISAALSAYGYSITHLPHPPVRNNLANLKSSDLAVIECTSAPTDEGIALANLLRAERHSLPIVVLATTSSEELAIAAVRLRAIEYLRYPIELERLAGLSRHARRDSQDADNNSTIVGDTPAARSIRAFIARVAAQPSNVLIIGETGPGRSLESELFGHEKGAFTGAFAAQDGKLRCKSLHRGELLRFAPVLPANHAAPIQGTWLSPDGRCAKLLWQCRSVRPAVRTRMPAGDGC